MIVIIVLTALLIAYGAFEYAAHRRRVLSIPIRIHVNGTRGKSSVTRLISAGLRAGGLRTYAKVTGTLPRIIDEQGLEIPIIRLHPVNILEQVKVFRYFFRNKPEAIVIECMAVMPDYQWICEHHFVNATHGVITNSRMDHVIEMGPSLENITNSLANTIPVRAPMFTAAKNPMVMNVFKSRAKSLGSRIVQSDEETIDNETLRRFSYIEHPSNVALALEICQSVGVDRETALEGMVNMHPDPGALLVYEVEEDNRKARFFSALAANDAQSTQAIWERCISLYPDAGKRILLLNTRGDRFNRSVHLVEMVAKAMEFDILVSMGESTDMLTAHLSRVGIPSNKVVKIGQVKPEKAYKTILDLIDDRAFVFALGNAGHGGLAVVEIFRTRSRKGKEEVTDNG